MADGDEIHANLPRRYLRIYKDLCSEAFDPEDAAHELARVVVQDVRKFGDLPILLIRSCVEKLQRMMHADGIGRHFVDYAAAQHVIDRLERKFSGGPQAMETAKRAIRHQIEEYRQGGDPPSLVSTLKGYLASVSVARFSERVPLTGSHLNGLSNSEVENRLSSMTSHSEREYDYLANSLARITSVKGRLARRPFNRGPGLHDEAL